MNEDYGDEDRIDYLEESNRFLLKVAKELTEENEILKEELEKMKWDADE